MEWTQVNPTIFNDRMFRNDQGSSPLIQAGRKRHRLEAIKSRYLPLPGTGRVLKMIDCTCFQLLFDVAASPAAIPVV